MDFNELLNLLEMEDASEFKYFENFAALVEAEEFIDCDAVHELLSYISEEELSEFTHSYFEDAASALPDSESDSFIFLQNMEQSLLGKLNSSKADYIDELFKFRKWYIFDSEVEILSESGKKSVESFFYALVLYREARIAANTKDTYKFDAALSYDIEEYKFSIDISGEEYGDEEEIPDELREAGLTAGAYSIEDLSDEGYEYERGLEEINFGE